MSCGGTPAAIGPCIAATRAAIRAAIEAIEGRDYTIIDGRMAQPDDRARRGLIASIMPREVFFGRPGSSGSARSHEVAWRVDLFDHVRHQDPVKLGWNPLRVEGVIADAQAVVNTLFQHAVGACVPQSYSSGDGTPKVEVVYDTDYQVVGVVLTFVLVY